MIFITHRARLKSFYHEKISFFNGFRSLIMKCIMEDFMMNSTYRNKPLIIYMASWVVVLHSEFLGVIVNM